MALGEDSVKASLPTINLHRLQDGDRNEADALLRACLGHGFFYLDLQGESELILVWREILGVCSSYFAQPPEHKMLDCRKSDTQG